ncbi:MAG: hypothetical protein IPQ07_43425 [Myxococcales bacterium]|nr:hypothetical protein [Myxococcales bacterium]
MRSSRNALFALVLAACGNDAAPENASTCTTSTLTYQNFGAPFVLDWCRGCHSSALPDGMRQSAPLGVDFDDLDHLRAWSAEIETRVTGDQPSMPPAAGPSPEERAMLAEWIRCGAP